MNGELMIYFVPDHNYEKNPDYISHGIRYGLFCDKDYWDQNHCIDDGSSDNYEDIVEAFEQTAVSEDSDGIVEWCGISLDIIKANMAKCGIMLLIDDETFINEYKAEFGQDPRYP